MDTNNILFFNEEVSYRVNDKRKIREWIRHIIYKWGNSPGNINIILCPDQYLLAINNTYLNHDSYTDILTFNQSEEQTIISGDIYISLDRIKANAKEYKVRISDELHRVIIHGILHLMGGKDSTDAERREMREAEDKCLSLRPPLT
ncbi:MAG: rRNA maturation RNase YbeY [Bacteroidales bacterium]|nr:rRNA maturation RNase YbeY [Bacteroidales bacterium]